MEQVKHGWVPCLSTHLDRRSQVLHCPPGQNHPGRWLVVAARKHCPGNPPEMWSHSWTGPGSAGFSGFAAKYGVTMLAIHSQCVCARVLTSASTLLSSLILLPLRLRYVRLGHFSDSVSRDPERLLSLSSSWSTHKHHTCHTNTLFLSG